MEDDFDTGPDLIIQAGDCEFWGRCGGCDEVLGILRPDQSLDILGAAWDIHVNAGQCPSTAVRGEA